MSGLVGRLTTRLNSLDERSTRLLVTAAASYLGRFGSGIVILVTIPMTRSALTPELFGVWMMLSSLLGFFAFADLGIGNGLLNQVTAATASADRSALRRTVAAGYVCTLSVGVLLIGSWALWLRCAARPTLIAGEIPLAIQSEVRIALTLFVVLLAINVSASLIQKVQLGAQQGQWIGVSQFFAALGTLVAVPVTLHVGGGLPALVLASLGVQVAVNLVNTALWLRRSGVSASFFHLRWSDRFLVGGLLRSGSLFFVLQVAVAFAFQSDAVVITQVLGQHAYGDFAVVQKLFLFVSMILVSGMMGLWPAFGDAIARRDIVWAKRALWRGLLIAGVVATMAVLALIVSMGWITRHWLHVATPPALMLTSLLGLWTVVDAMGAVGGAFMNGANALRAQSVFAIAMAALAFSGKWWLTPIWGAAGAVAATLIAYVLICVPGQIFVFRRMFADLGRC